MFKGMARSKKTTLKNTSDDGSGSASDSPTLVGNEATSSSSEGPRGDMSVLSLRSEGEGEVTEPPQLLTSEVSFSVRNEIGYSIRIR